MSSLGNAVGLETVISLEARKSYALGVRFLNIDDSLVDLTGATVRLVFGQPAHLGGAVLLAQDGEILTDPTYGAVQFKLQALDLNLVAGEYPFIITLLSANGFSTPVVKGVLAVRDNADLLTTGTFPSVSTGENLAVYLEQGDLVQVKIDNVDGLATIVNAKVAAFDAQAAAMLASMQALQGGGGGGSLLEDPLDPGTYIISGAILIEDPADLGTYLIGA